MKGKPPGELMAWFGVAACIQLYMSTVKNKVWFVVVSSIYTVGLCDSFFQGALTFEYCFCDL